MNTVTRSVEVVTKRDKRGDGVTYQFKTLDSILVREGPDGTRTTLPSRCAEIDKEMLTLLGVSKAVLTNVIFCHQEDNCWPMSEGKVLKEKFDQIFGSMGYVKALAKIKKQRDDSMKELKTLKEHLKFCTEVKHNKERLDKTLKELQQKLENQRTFRNAFDTKLVPIEKELAQIALEMKGQNDIQSRVSSKKAELAEKARSMDYLKEKISSVFQGPLSDLKLKKQEFLSEFSNRKKELISISEEVKKIETEIKMNSSKSSAFSIQRGKLEQKQKFLQTCIEKRDAFVSKIRRDFADLHLIEAGDDANEPEKIVRALKLRYVQMEEVQKKALAEYESTLEQLESELEEEKTCKTRLTETIRMKQETQDMRESEIKDLMAKLQLVESSAGDVLKHSEEVERLASIIREKVKEMMEELDGEVSDLKVAKYKLDNDVMDFKKCYNDLIRNLVSNVNELKKAVKGSDLKIAEFRSRLVQHKESSRKQERTRKQDLEKMKEIIQTLSNLMKDVENNTLSDQNEKDSLDHKEQELAQLLHELSRKKDESVQSQVKIRGEIDGQKSILREFDDNEKLYGIRSEIAEIEASLKEDEALTTTGDFDSLKRRQSELQKNADKLRSEKGIFVGQMTANTCQMETVEDELRTAKNKKADSEFKKALINVVTLETLCDDMNKYYKVLDKAVTTYHVKKLEEVNHLMGHFWRITYQGSDIETIKIVCDDQIERSADQRKAYNYRVVMIKEKVEMDMRGRCSMGQKVLASLVIRIALAQIFCVNCLNSYSG